MDAILSSGDSRRKWILFLLSSIGAWAIFYVSKAWYTWSKLPPGPRGLPVLGNLLQLRNGRHWLTFADWKKKYGPLIYLNFAGQPAIVLGSQKVAADLQDRRAHIYSDRPFNYVATELLTGGLAFAFAQHGDVWKRQRKGAHEALSPQMSKNYCGFQETESIILLDQLMTAPDDWDKHFRRTSISLMLSVLYGSPPLLDSRDPHIERVNQFTERAVEAATPGAFLVEYFTWMKYLPRWMTPWRAWAEDHFKRDSEMFESMFAGVEERMNAGDETASVVATLIRDREQKGLTMKEAAWLPVTLYAAGAETTSSQLAWFLQAIVLHPEIQKRAQKEIDHVVGSHRLPTFDDFAKLTYIRALVKEILRWRPTNPIFLPHRLCQDDYYEGYFVPKDSLCITNLWAINLDKEIYGEDAEEFKPERFLNENGEITSSVPDSKDEGHFSFGFGRRICVGRHVANNSLFIQIASLLWAFDISPEVDASGNPCLPDSLDCIDYGLVVRPVPFRCKFSARHPEVMDIVAQAKADRGIQASHDTRT
ncbi:hypothetical protein GYMLUDRAFT_256026 [Collybiopsis luxurians FD-317 M1]|nr:hypothetical protein GYMLUDRAFT_256026 [Collybiopsis luxurians FD-317 M1]